jgi:hypothetical protein
VQLDGLRIGDGRAALDSGDDELEVAVARRHTDAVGVVTTYDLL